MAMRITGLSRNKQNDSIECDSDFIQQKKIKNNQPEFKKKNAI